MGQAIGFVNLLTPSWVTNPTTTTVVVLLGVAVLPMFLDLQWFYGFFKTCILATLQLRKRQREMGGKKSEKYLQWCRDHCLGTAGTVYKTKVGMSDLDYFGHMNNSKYLKYCDMARSYLGFESNYLSTVLSMGNVVVVAAQTIRFRRELKLNQQFEIESKMVGWDEISIFLELRFVTYKKTGGKNGATEKVVNATVLQRMQLLKKMKTRTVLDKMGLTDLPDVHMPHADVAGWAATLDQCGDRVRADLEREAESKKKQ